MNNDNSIATIASFAVLKALSDSKKYRSPYQLLSNFIEYIVCNEQLHVFSLPEMKYKLQAHFGFKVPESVIKTSVQTLKNIKRADNAYRVDVLVCNTSKQFIAEKTDKEETYGKIVDEIFECIQKTYPDADRDKTIKAIVSYLIDDDRDSPFRDAISTFIISNENDKELQGFLNDVREGGILYLGINRNVGEWGSLKQPLTLYLDTEILFDLVGYNGSMYLELAQDFYQFVQKGNRKGKISLRYFSDVKSEIDRFFRSAELIVERSEVYLEEKPAMTNIVNGCQTSADVRVRQADFFSKLRNMGILEDETNNYYADELRQYNLEHAECLTEREVEGWKAISNINKLRRGERPPFELDSHFLIVSDSKNVLDASENQHKQDKKDSSAGNIARYAVSLNHIVNLLWYKLDGGFGGEKFPANALVLLRARIVLSEIVAKKASEIYRENIDQYTKGEINQEQLGARILALREKPLLPEEIQSDNCEDILDFSPEMISRLEVEIQSHRQYRSEQEKLVHTMQTATQKILADKAEELKERDEVILQQRNELQELRQREEAREKRKKHLSKIGYVVVRVVFLMALISLVCYAHFKDGSLNKWIGITIDVGTLLGFVAVIHNFWQFTKKH